MALLGARDMEAEATEPGLALAIKLLLDTSQILEQALSVPPVPAEEPKRPDSLCGLLRDHTANINYSTEVLRRCIDELNRVRSIVTN